MVTCACVLKTATKQQSRHSEADRTLSRDSEAPTFRTCGKQAERTPMTARILRTWLPYALAAVLLYVAWSSLPNGGATSYRLTSSARFAYANLRQLLGAIQTYRDEHGGMFPHDDRVSDHALYHLRPYLDSKFLACARVANGKDAPSWDDNEKRARNVGWKYVNVSDPWEILPSEIIIASRPRDGARTVFFANRSGAIHSRRVTANAGNALVGSYLTDESFVVASKEALEEWQRIGPHGAGWEMTSSGTGKVIRTTHPARKVTYEYDYSDGRPSSRRIQCDGPEIQERIFLDDFGRIKKIERAPEDWEKIWVTCNSDVKK